MTVAILLRLISGAQANGRVAGHAEIVDTGQTETFRDEGEMLAILERASRAISGVADPPAQPELGLAEASG